MSWKTYLGDSVYVEADEAGRIVLTTENGIPPPSNLIVIEPEVLSAFDMWRESMRARMKDRRSNKP